MRTLRRSERHTLARAAAAKRLEYDVRVTLFLRFEKGSFYADLTWPTDYPRLSYSNPKGGRNALPTTLGRAPPHPFGPLFSWPPQPIALLQLARPDACKRQCFSLQPLVFLLRLTEKISPND